MAWNRLAREGAYTLPELLVAMVIVAILTALAVPRFDAYVSAQRAAGALNRFAADVHLTRMLAVREGHRAVLVLERSPLCRAAATTAAGQRWRIVVRTSPEREVFHRTAGDGMPRLCVEMNGSDSLAFNSRGLLIPFSNRTVRARHGSVADTAVVSVLGRIYRRR